MCCLELTEQGVGLPGVAPLVLDEVIVPDSQFRPVGRQQLIFSHIGLKKNSRFFSIHVIT